MAGKSWFVVREEGGAYEFMHRGQWERERGRVPIFGVVEGGVMWIYDRILLRLGYGPVRTQEWQ